MNSQKKMPSPWILAIRPKTLPAAVAPVIVGASMAFQKGYFNWLTLLACLIVAVLLQVGSNLANDVFDYEKGADAGNRLGPMRVTQAGLLTPSKVKLGLGIVLGFSAIIGTYLVIIGGWPILIVGVAAILSAVAYTGGPFPLGYFGLGDIFVFVFFGLVATVGTYYLLVGEVSPAVWLMAVAMGFLTVNILVVNNLRDIASDRRVNKRTLAVRLGQSAARFQYTLLMIGAYLIPVFLWLFRWTSPYALLTWVSLPIACYWVVWVFKNKGPKLNQALAGTGQLELVYALMFAVGMLVSE